MRDSVEVTRQRCTPTAARKMRSITACREAHAPSDLWCRRAVCCGASVSLVRDSDPDLYCNRKLGFFCQQPCIINSHGSIGELPAARLRG